jgi:hypothetical protein
MNLVSFALRRPVTVLVLAIAAVLTGILAIDRMPRDIFPDLGVPVLYVAQPFGGMDPAQMEGFLVNFMNTIFSISTALNVDQVDQGRRIKLQFLAPIGQRDGRTVSTSIVPAVCRSGPCLHSSCRFDAQRPSRQPRLYGRNWQAGAEVCRMLPCLGFDPCSRPSQRLGAASLGGALARRGERRSRPAARLQHEPR